MSSARATSSNEENALPASAEPEIQFPSAIVLLRRLGLSSNRFMEWCCSTTAKSLLLNQRLNCSVSDALCEANVMQHFHDPTDLSSTAVPLFQHLLNIRCATAKQVQFLKCLGHPTVQKSLRILYDCPFGTAVASSTLNVECSGGL